MMVGGQRSPLLPCKMDLECGLVTLERSHYILQYLSKTILRRPSLRSYLMPDKKSRKIVSPWGFYIINVIIIHSGQWNSWLTYSTLLLRLYQYKDFFKITHWLIIGKSAIRLFIGLSFYICYLKKKHYYFF